MQGLAMLSGNRAAVVGDRLQLPVNESLLLNDRASQCSPRSVSGSSHCSYAEREFSTDLAFNARAIHDKLVIRGLVGPDIILRAFGKEYPVHKIILIAFSEFFESRIVRLDGSRSYAVLHEELAADGTKDGLPVYSVDSGPEMSQDGFEYVLDVMYSRNTQKLTFDNALQILSAAQYLRVEHIVNQALNFVLDNLSTDCFLLCLHWANQHSGNAQSRVLAACRALAKLEAPAHFNDWQDVLLGADMDFLRSVLSSPDLAVTSENARYLLAKRIGDAAAAAQVDVEPFRQLTSECIEYAWLTSSQLVRASADNVATSEKLASAALWHLQLRDACLNAPIDAEELPMSSSSHEAMSAVARPFTFGWSLNVRDLKGIKTKLESPPAWYGGSKWHIQCSIREGCSDYGLFVYRLPLPEEGSLASRVEDGWDHRTAVRMRFKLWAVICSGLKPRVLKEIDGGNVLKCGFGWGSREMIPKATAALYTHDDDRLVVMCTLALATHVRPDMVKESSSASLKA